MPKISLAVMESKAREYMKSASKPEDRRYIRILAKEGKRRLESFAHEPTEQEVLEMFRRITYADPVGEEAAACLDGHKACCNHAQDGVFNANAARRIKGRATSAATPMPADRKPMILVGEAA